MSNYIMFCYNICMDISIKLRRSNRKKSRSTKMYQTIWVNFMRLRIFWCVLIRFAHFTIVWRAFVHFAHFDMFCAISLYFVCLLHLMCLIHIAYFGMFLHILVYFHIFRYILACFGTSLILTRFGTIHVFSHIF